MLNVLILLAYHAVFGLSKAAIGFIAEAARSRYLTQSAAKLVVINDWRKRLRACMHADGQRLKTF